MNNGMESFIDCIKDFSELPRQAVCTQCLLTLNKMEMSSFGDFPDVIEVDGKKFYSVASIKDLLSKFNTENALSNLSRSFRAMSEAGFVERAVMNPKDEVFIDPTYYTVGVKVFWRLSDKGYVALGYSRFQIQ